MLSHKDSATESPHPWRRILIATGTARYEHLEEDAQLPSVERDLEQMKAFLCGQLKYQDAAATSSLNPTKGQLEEMLQRTLVDDRNDNDVVIFYYSGHGDEDQGQHYLLTSNSKHDQLHTTALETEGLAKFLGKSSVRLVLLILDTCYAGYGAGEILQAVDKIKKRFEGENVSIDVLASARPKEEAKAGAFVKAFLVALREPDIRYAGERQPLLVLRSVANDTNYYLDKESRQRVSIRTAAVPTGHPPFFPNPRYRPDVPEGVDFKTQRRLASMDPNELALHWGPRARGVELESQPGWYFTGRTGLLTELVSWLKTPVEEAQPLVITGRPRIGKSAVLARLVTLADPDYRHNARLDTFPPETLPPGRQH